MHKQSSSGYSVRLQHGHSLYKCLRLVDPWLIREGKFGFRVLLYVDTDWSANSGLSFGALGFNTYLRAE